MKIPYAQVLSYQDLVSTRPSLVRLAFCASKCCAVVDKTPEVRYARVKGLGFARVVMRPKAGHCTRCGYAVFYSNNYRILTISWQTELARLGIEDDSPERIRTDGGKAS